MTKTSKKDKRCGFTFAEILVVLTIISVLTAVVAPYATRNNKHLHLEQEALNLKVAVDYLRNEAMSGNEITRLVLRPKETSFALEAGTDNGTGISFAALPGLRGMPHRLEAPLRFADTTGFDTDGERECLVFDARQAWPNGEIILANTEEIITVKIEGIRTFVEHSSE
jgi:prepilin-type N-terminal cleavage/methylation domain-containing protein